MIIDLLHAADVAEGLAADPPASADDWPWARQLRFYLARPGAAGEVCDPAVLGGALGACRRPLLGSPRGACDH